MQNSSGAFVNDNGLILSIAVLCKDNYSIAAIDRLFMYAGASETWKKDIEYTSGSQRMHRVNEWIEGIKENASGDSADKLVTSFITFILKDVEIDSTETAILRQALDGQSMMDFVPTSSHSLAPSNIDILLERIIKGLPRATQPFRQRRIDKPAIGFTDEYDVQDLFNALLQPWVKDIRQEEYTPSYAGSSNRMDFLLREHKIVCEIKYVRNAPHARKVGDELTIDIAHYRRHPDCEKLYVVIYDSQGLISNPDGLKTDIESDSESLEVVVFIVPQRTLP